MSLRPAIHLVCGITNGVPDDSRHLKTVDTNELEVPEFVTAPFKKYNGENAKIRFRDGRHEFGEYFYNGFHPDGNYVPGCLGYIVSVIPSSDALYALFYTLPELRFSEGGNWHGYMLVPKRDAKSYEMVPEPDHRFVWCQKHGLLWNGHDFFDCARYAVAGHEALWLAGWDVAWHEMQLFLSWGWA